MSYKDYITEVPNFPEEGVNFKDISPLLANEEVFGDAIVEMRNLTHKVPDYWIGIDVKVIEESVALAYEGLVDNDLTGIAISMGAGMCNVCVMYQGMVIGLVVFLQ